MGRNGALMSMATGESSGYAMAPLQARGVLLIHAQTPGSFHFSSLSVSLLSSPTRPPTSLPITVQPGMVIGEAAKSQDPYPNPCIEEQLALALQYLHVVLYCIIATTWGCLPSTHLFLDFDAFTAIPFGSFFL